MNSSGAIAWEAVFRIAGYAACAFVLAAVLVGGVAPPDIWYGDTPYRANVADRIGVVVVAAASLAGVPAFILSHLFPGSWRMLGWIDFPASLPAAIGPWVAAASAGLLALKSSPRPLTLSVTEQENRRAVHLRGPRLLSGDGAIAAGWAAESQAIARTGRGIYIAPGLPISMRRETRQVMVVGSIGGGKSELLKFILSQMILRGDRILAHDPKGELLSEWPTNDCGIAVLSPVDARSLAWNIEADCRGEAAARELASKFITSSSTSDGTWVNGAREVLFGLVRHLQQTEPRWHWGHLSDLLSLPCSGMRDIVEKSHPSALKYLTVDANGLETKTTISFLVSLDSEVSPLFRQLASAWGHDFKGERLSLVSWLLQPDARPQSILLVSAADYSQLSRAWTGAAISLMSRIVASPKMGNSVQTKVAIVLDECKQLGRLEDFQALMEVGRSRGIRVVTAWQDLRQIEQVYSEKADFDVFTALPKTKVVFQCSPGASSKHVADEWIGQRLVRLRDETYKGGKQDSTASHETWIPVITPQELDSSLGVVRNAEGDDAARGVVVGIGPDVLQLEWPPAGWTVRRPSRVPAEWTGDGGAEPTQE